ncbi:MAG TPA: protein kinase [Thermoanaerobaculia bacterium]|nr:protein kinase [Thermoanaerobaculia bacterium]
MIGRVVGSYEIVERIGEGGMGTVWRAVDVMLEREVAIKAIRPDLAAEPQIVERFRSEAKILARVHHPAIATIYSFFRDGGELYLAMEFVRGRTLAQVLRQDGALAWPRAVALVAAALEGIDQVHRTGIIHRDLKPDNLMLTEAGEIKVMDFGIARAVGASHLTRTGLMVGTLRYMSPEQLRGEEVDHRADLYALGIVLYEMLTGRVPFTGASEYEAIRAQVEDPPVPPGHLVAGLPPWLDRVVLTALAKFPGQRFASAAAMADSLAAARPNPPSTADLQTRLQPAASTPAGSAAVPALAANLSPSGAARAADGTASSYRAIGLGRSRGLLLGIAGGLLFLAVAAGVAWFLRVRPEPTAAPPPAPATTAPTAQTAPRAPMVPISTSKEPAAAPVLPSAGAPASTPVPTALPTTNPAFPEPPPKTARSSPPTSPSAASPEPAVEESPAPAPALPTPAAPSPGVTAEVPAGAAGTGEAATKELSQLGDQLDAAAGQLADAASDFQVQKKDRGEARTTADDKLQAEIDALGAATTRFNRRVNASFLRRATWRLKLEGEGKRRAEVLERVREIDEIVERIERLLAQTPAGEPVLTVWREVRRIGRQIDQLSRRP